MTITILPLTKLGRLFYKWGWIKATQIQIEASTGCVVAVRCNRVVKMDFAKEKVKIISIDGKKVN